MGPPWGLLHFVPSWGPTSPWRPQGRTGSWGSERGLTCWGCQVHAGPLVLAARGTCVRETEALWVGVPQSGGATSTWAPGTGELASHT